MTKPLKLPSRLECLLLALLGRPRIGVDLMAQVQPVVRCSAIAIYASLRRMKERGWVTVERHEDDGRKRLFRATPAGKRALARGREAYVVKL